MDVALMQPLRAAAEFGRDMAHKKTGPRWLSLIGNSGTGKTHLAKGIWKAWENKGQWYRKAGVDMVKHGLFKSFSRMCNEMRSGAFGIFQSCADADFLVLDDLGAEYATEFSQRQLASMLDQRLGKWTVITSNLSMNDISEIDVRIADRMIRGENEVVEIDCVSYAMRDKQ
jgi:DNA replication protein DnaC